MDGADFTFIVWHIDETQTTNHNEGLSSNFHPWVRLIQADGLRQLQGKGPDQGDAGDPFPGATMKRYISGLTMPHTKSYAQQDSWVSIGGITDSDANMKMYVTVQPDRQHRTFNPYQPIQMGVNEPDTGFQQDPSAYIPTSFDQVPGVAQVNPYLPRTRATTRSLGPPEQSSQVILTKPRASEHTIRANYLTSPPRRTNRSTNPSGPMEFYGNLATGGGFLQSVKVDVSSPCGIIPLEQY